MTPQQTIANGLLGTGATVGTVLASLTIGEVNAWLTTVSLVIGITVGVFTLCRFIRNRP